MKNLYQIRNQWLKWSLIISLTILTLHLVSCNEKSKKDDSIALSVNTIIRKKTMFGNCLEVRGIRNKLIGKWRCVKHDYRGFHKYTIDQAKQIEMSILHFEKDEYFYEGVTFIEPPCLFSKIRVSNCDTANYYFYGTGLFNRYSNSEISKLIRIDFDGIEDEYGGCLDCAAFLLKEDTLINFCGGYTFFLVKDNE